MLCLVLVLAGAVLALGAGAPPQLGSLPPLPLSKAYFSSSHAGGRNGSVVLVPDVWLHGLALDLQRALRPEDCSDQCAKHSGCSWFVWCGEQAGCKHNSQVLEYQQCQLLQQAGNCTEEAPLMAAEGAAAGQATSGFPLALSPPPPEFSGWATRPGVGLLGSDFDCVATVMPGLCAFHTPLDAVAMCSKIPACRSVVVLQNGTDGCSGLLAILKNSQLTPDSTSVSPTVYSLEKMGADPMTSNFLHGGEFSVILPDDAAVQANTTAAQSSNGTSGGNSTEWLGCLVAPHALMDGSTVDLLDGVASEEACCRECRQMGAKCNAWNYCPLAGGCRMNNSQVNLQLNYSQCELKFQELVAPAIGWPLSVVAKGNGVPFSGGGPNFVWGPPLTGFTRRIGQGLWAQGFNCNGSLRAEMNDCVLPLTLPGMGQYCEDTAVCSGFVLKPAGSLRSGVTVGLFQQNATTASIIANPNSVAYLRDDMGSATSGSSSSSSLSAGEVAGIAVGVAACALAIGASIALLLAYRRKRRVAQHAAKANGGSGTSSPKDLEQGRRDQGGGDACITPVSAASAESQQAASASGSHSFSQQQQRQSELAGGGSGGMSIRVAGPAAPSPFAALALLPSLESGGSGAGSSSGAALGSDSAVAHPAGQGSAPDTRCQGSSGDSQEPQALEELLQHRARQDSSFMQAGVQQASPILGPLSSSAAAAQNNSVDLTAPEGGSPRVGDHRIPPELRKWIIDPQDITPLTWATGRLQQLGCGASGMVYRAMYRGEVVAIKEMAIGDHPDNQLAFLAEAARMELLRHPHVVTFYGVCVSPERGAGLLVLECCEGRDLHSALQLQSAAYSPPQRLFGWYMKGRNVAFEVAKALNYLHAKGLVHLDIKSSNVLLTGRGTAKLSDMGLSRLKNGKTFLSDLAPVGTFAWTAPEVLWGHPCNQSADIYGFGVLMWEIITGEAPLRGRLRLPAVPSECPQEVADLMLQSLASDPSQRPTAEQLVCRLALLSGAHPAAPNNA